MKRSEINGAIRGLEALAARYRFALPDFCRWTPADWADRGPEYDELRDNMLGWDVTDYGMGDFRRLGLTLITLRSGSQTDPRYPKPYAEKLMLVGEGQVCPMHFHWHKMEDIINRGGGDLAFRLYNADGDGGLASTEVALCRDGRRGTVQAGGEVILKPGQSLTLLPGCYHEFTALPGTGDVLAGEVSVCNDDKGDNRFLEPLGRFPEIEEDEPPYRLLCGEYPR